MSHTVRLLPSGRTFQAESQETVLEAALRSGVDLPYRCAGGSCGECKARLVSGEPGHVDFHEYALTEAEKLSGTVLLCSIHAGSDLVVETGEPSVVPLQHIGARVAGRQEAGNYSLLQLRTPRTRTLRFLAGQYVRLTLPNGYRVNKPIASCPCNGMLLQFHLHHAEDAPRDAQLSSLRVGEPVEVEGPYGSFTFDETSSRPAVMVAENSGFAPIKSLIEHAIALEWPQPMQLFWLAEQGSHYLANLCRAWGDALDGFEYVLLEGAPGEAAEAVAAAARPEADWYVAASSMFGDLLDVRRDPRSRLKRYGE